MKGKKRLTAFILALLLALLAAAPSDAVCAASFLTELRSEVVELNDQLTLVKRVQYNSASADNAVEHYFEYVPGGSVLPLVSYGASIKGAASAPGVFQGEAEDGVTITGLTNGGFFVMSTGVSLGPVIRDGIVRTGGYGESVIAFREDGTARIGDPSLDISLSFPERSIRYGKVNFNKSITGSNGICVYTQDFGSTNGATFGTYSVLVRILDGSAALGGAIEGVVESAQECSVASPLQEGTVLLCIALDTPYANALTQLQDLQIGERVELQFRAAEAFLDARHALGFESWLVRDGGPVSGLDSVTRAPRTAFGVRRDGSCILYTVDGRQKDYSMGLTAAELAERLRELGCTEAVNLDGGASTQLFAVYPGFEKEMQVNRDSDATYLRSCANFVCFANFGEKTGTPVRLHLYPFDEYVLSGTSVPVYVKATDAGWFSCGAPENVTYTSDRMGSMDGSVYTAGSKAGTGIITARSGRLSGSMRIYIVSDPDSIAAFADGKEVSSLQAGIGKSLQLSAKAVYRGQELRSGAGCYTWSVSGEIGSIDENGVFTAAGEHGATGTITVSAGKTKQVIAVTLQQTLPAEELQNWIRDIVQNVR